jgi:hypothetical protein
LLPHPQMGRLVVGQPARDRGARYLALKHPSGGTTNVTRSCSSVIGISPAALRPADGACAGLFAGHI